MARSTTASLLSVGLDTMWGFSPSFNLLDNLDARDNQNLENEPINILLCNPGDIRHILQTISMRLRSTSRPIHFYLYESSDFVLARALLLLDIAFDWKLPIKQRCNLFLEVYGNLLVQERTTKYIDEKAQELIDLIYDEHGFLSDLVELDHLKTKKRDELVDIFRSWSPKVKCNIAELRDQRLRHYYETRYDFRRNVIDWDYTMNLKPIPNASVIHIKQFRNWRETGIAHEFGDQTYTMPNRSMSSYAEMNDRSHGLHLRKGFWLDIVVGPYIGLGVDCFKSNKYAEDLFEVHNKGTGVEQNRHNVTEVCVYNILSFLYEIETKSIYQMKTAHKIYSGIGDDEIENDGNTIVEQLSPSITEETKKEAQKRAETIVETLNNVKIIPLTGNPRELLKKQKYQNRFDHVYLSSRMVDLLQPEGETGSESTIASVMKSEGIISCESITYYIQLSKEKRLLYLTKLQEMTKAVTGLSPLFQYAKADEPTEEDLFDPKAAVLTYRFLRS